MALEAHSVRVYDIRMKQNCWSGALVLRAPMTILVGWQIPNQYPMES
jgi:hypothetical protein